jgi:hypothetical protein
VSADAEPDLEVDSGDGVAARAGTDDALIRTFEMIPLAQ